MGLFDFFKKKEEVQVTKPEVAPVQPVTRPTVVEQKETQTVELTTSQVEVKEQVPVEPEIQSTAVEPIAVAVEEEIPMAQEQEVVAVEAPAPIVQEPVVVEEPSYHKKAVVELLASEQSIAEKEIQAVLSEKEPEANESQWQDISNRWAQLGAPASGRKVISMFRDKLDIEAKSKRKIFGANQTPSPLDPQPQVEVQTTESELTEEEQVTQAEAEDQPAVAEAEDQPAIAEAEDQPAIAEAEDQPAIAEPTDATEPTEAIEDQPAVAEPTDATEPTEAIEDQPAVAEPTDATDATDATDNQPAVAEPIEDQPAVDTESSEVPTESTEENKE